MPVSYVVDGYNLLFHLGLLDRRGGAHALEQARHRVLEQVRQSLGAGDHAITVVFDSGRNRRTVPPPQEYLGVEVRYSGGGAFADDVIEAIIAECSRPQQLVVVSNDRRIREAARRKGATPWSCDDLLAHGEARGEAHGEARGKDGAAKATAPERPALSREEVRHWLEEFGDLADDPDFREVFDPFPFKDEP